MKHYFLLFLCFGLYTCTCNETKDENGNLPGTEKAKIEIPINDLIITEADKLRLRAEPNLKADILETLPINTVLEFINKRSAQKETIEIKGLKHNAHWLKVKTTGEIAGWVYGSEGVDGYNPMIRFLFHSDKVKQYAVKIVENISASDLEELTGFKGIHEGWGNYSGYYQYHDFNEKSDRNGQFEFVARHFIPDYKFWLSATYTGSYRGGFPSSQIIEKLIGVEGESMTILDFEEGTFKCKRISNHWNSEGEKGVNEDNAPEICSFDALN